MVIDTHAHVFPDKLAQRAADNIGAFYDIPMRHDGSVGTLLQAMDAGGVTRAVVCSVALSPERVDTINTFIAGQVALHPERLLGLATLHPQMDDVPSALSRALSCGLRGVKLHSDMQGISLLDPCMDAVYAACEGVCPLLLHTGDKRYHYDNPAMIPEILRRFPRLTLICAHMGGYSEWEEARTYLTGESVLVDSSSASFCLGEAGMLSAIRHFGAERVLFGSDFPMWSPGEELSLLRRLPLSEREQDLILFENAQRVFNL